MANTGRQRRNGKDFKVSEIQRKFHLSSKVIGRHNFFTNYKERAFNAVSYIYF